LNNIIRYANWSSPANIDAGLIASDIHNAVYGNNLIVLNDPLRLRQCPSGYIPPPPVEETCDGETVVPPTEGTYAQCLNILPPGYRRTWFNNRDLNASKLPVKHAQNGSDGLAAQQQWP